jgi:hypothetical protein
MKALIDETTGKTAGQVAFEGYQKSLNMQAGWLDQGDSYRQAWEDAAIAVVELGLDPS